MANEKQALRRSHVRHFLSEQKMVMGVEYQIFKIWLATVLILLVGSIQMESIIFGCCALTCMFAVLIFFRKVSANDAFIHKKYMRYMRQANAYEPWPQVRKEGISGNINPRPLGFGRNRLV